MTLGVTGNYILNFSKGDNDFANAPDLDLMNESHPDCEIHIEKSHAKNQYLHNTIHINSNLF